MNGHVATLVAECDRTIWMIRPLRPRAGVERRLESRERQREDLVRRGHTGAAIDGHQGLNPERLELCAELGVREEVAVFVEVLRRRRTHRAWNMASDGVHGLDLPAESFAGSGVQQRAICRKPSDLIDPRDG